MALFTPAFDTALSCDAYLVDTERDALLLEITTAQTGRVVEEVLDRTVLMGRSVFDVRGLTFALFAAQAPGRFLVAMTEPVAAGAFSMLRDTLASFGPLAESRVALAESELHPLVAYEEGRVSFFDSAATRAWRPIAGNRGLRILSVTPTHDPDPDVEIRECAP